MKRTLLLVTAALSIGVLSCKKTPAPTPEPAKPLPINISIPLTRVTDSAYESGDVVGLFVVNGGSTLSASGNHVDNEAFTFDGSTWKAGNDLYWKDGSTPASFYCYYPRIGNVSDISAIPFSVSTDQSAPSGYRASELLWGSRQNVAPTSDVVEITSTHRMSNLLVYITPGNGYSAETLALQDIEITLNNLKVNATLNAANGEVTATGTPADITPYLEADHFRALVPPQSLQDQTLISLKVGDYSFSLKETITLKSNTRHTVTLTVNKVSEGINIGIGDWETDDQDYGGTVN